MELKTFLLHNLWEFLTQSLTEFTGFTGWRLSFMVNIKISLHFELAYISMEMPSFSCKTQIILCFPNIPDRGKRTIQISFRAIKCSGIICFLQIVSCLTVYNWIMGCLFFFSFFFSNNISIPFLDQNVLQKNTLVFMLKQDILYFFSVWGITWTG